MRLLPRKHVLQRDWLVHLFAVTSVAYPITFLLSDSPANRCQLPVLYPLFLLQWYHGFWQTEKHVPGHFLFLTFIASWAMVLHWSGVFLFFYGLVFLFKISRLMHASFAICIQAIWIALLAYYLDFSSTFILIAVVVTLLGGHADYLFFKHIISQRDLLMKQEELEYMARERERERIARDLHDVLGHTLSSIALKSELAEKLLASSQISRAQRELSDIAQTARTALAEVRQTVTGYRSGNFRSELTMASHSLSMAGIDADLPSKLPSQMSRDMENLLSLVMREAVTNVIRHAQAEHCRVQLYDRDNSWHLAITDDGIGWQGQYGNGLTGMRERLSVQGGRLRVERLSQGTKLVAVVDRVDEGAQDASH